MLQQDRLWLLLAKKLTYEANEEELQELNDLLPAHPFPDQYLQLFSELFKSGKLANCEEADEAFQRHLKRMKKQHVDFTANVNGMDDI